MPVRKAVIPAAGLGTRILPATKAIPKELLAIVDKPMIQLVVEEAAAAGITEVVIVTGPGKEPLTQHFTRAFELEAELERKDKRELLDAVRAIGEVANVSFVMQSEARGLGHAVSCARSAIGDEPFVVLLPDELFWGPQLINALSERYDRFGGSVIAVMEMPADEISSYGVVDPEAVEDDLVRMKAFVEKPPADVAPSNLGSIGRYVLHPGVFDALERVGPGAGGEIQLTDGIALAAKEHPAYAYIYRGRRNDAGRPLGYVKATLEAALQDPALREEVLAYLEQRS